MKVPFLCSAGEIMGSSDVCGHVRCVNRAQALFSEFLTILLTLGGVIFKLLYIIMSVIAYLSIRHGRVDEDDFVGSFILR